MKNTGGNKSKKVARKNVAPNSASMISKNVRRVADPCEMYAAVSKIYSGRRCDVMGSDGNIYQCTVRGKFLKGKRCGNSSLAIGVWIMVGFYDWEVRSDGSRGCDLLEIYTPAEKEKLKQLESHNLSAIMAIGELAGAEKEFNFSHFDLPPEQPELESLSSSTDEEEEDIDKPTVAVVVKTKQTPQEQNDWLAIDVNDI